jgi:predicted choloylglycine hydrolase
VLGKTLESTRVMSAVQEIEACGSHFEIGLAIGHRFADQIRSALESYSFLQQHLRPYHRSPEGQKRYQELLSLHRERYAGYLTELEGIAQGAGRRFEELFLVNLRGEYAGYLPGPAQGCSDCALVTAEAALIGHNEDGSPAFRGSGYLVHAQIKGSPAFVAFSYPGFLCGNAFGFNEEGICFSVDDVQPREIGMGAGRHFIARSLLEARSLDDAIARATVSGRASGFSYTIGSIAERRVVHVEVAAASHYVREIHGWYYHANHYRELSGIEQVIMPSSQARAQRAKGILEQNPPESAAGILSILGDTADERYPIYRTGAPPDRDATLCTALFDLDARMLRIYTGHPTRAPLEFQEVKLSL